MQSVNYYPNEARDSGLIRFITNAARIIVGVLFIISGLIKANDPLGFGYKLEEYFSVFTQATNGAVDFMALVPAATFLSMIVCILEIGLGVFLLLGAFRKFTVWTLLIMIILFTFLTFYSAYYDKVTDCGCFGDALKLTPWSSFTKDLILGLLIVILFGFRRYITPVATPAVRHTIAITLVTVSTLFTVYAWYFLPVVDFRPYKPGNDIKEGMTLPPNAKKDSTVMTFIYSNKKTGKDEEFTDMNALANLDTNVYVYKDRKDKVIVKGEVPPIHDFSLTDPATETEVTDSFLGAKGYRLLVVQYKIIEGPSSAQVRLNELATGLAGKVPIIGASGSSEKGINDYKKLNKVTYPIYIMDATTAKTIVRSNPGLVLFKDNKVVEYWPSTGLPDAQEVLAITQ